MKRKKTVLGGLLFFVLYLFGSILVLPAQAAQPGAVVLNEIAWAGSADSANDEWIELYNTSGSVVDLTGWTIIDDAGASTYALSGSIGAGAFYVIEKNEAAVQPRMADAVESGLSLANTGDSLVLKDNNGVTIDAVNSTGGMWFAGDSTTKATMERIDVMASGDDPLNWATGTGAGSTATASMGGLIVGTPGMLNSQAVVPAGAEVRMELSSDTPAPGETLLVTFYADNVQDLFSYGFEVDYDPSVLHYESAVAGDFLGEAGAIPTSFQAALEAGLEGKLLLAEARTIQPQTGVYGSGVLATVTFTVAGGEGVTQSLDFGALSFLGDTGGDMSVVFSGAAFVPMVATVDPVTGLTAQTGLDRYSIELSWTAVPGADHYRVERQSAIQTWVSIGEPTVAQFVDSDLVAEGGNIVPGVLYHYRVVAMNGTVESVPVEVQGVETRGIKGDNNRSDRVDGRDLEKLARHFGEAYADVSFDALADTTYDGLIDGSDLIDLGLTFGQIYQ